MKTITITQAQADARRVYKNGAIGLFVSAAAWLAAAIAAQWSNDTTALKALFIGGVLIFPLTTAILKIMGSTGQLPKGHPINGLAVQSALTVPIGIIVIFALGAAQPHLYLPAAMTLVGAHYLLFVSLYGIKFYGVLAAILSVGGIALMAKALAPYASYAPWVAAALLLAAGIVLAIRKEK